MRDEPIEPTEPTLDTRAHLLACIPLLALVAAVAWILIAGPSARVSEPEQPVATAGAL